MKQKKHMRAQVGALLKNCTEVAERVGVATVRRVMRKVDEAQLNAPAQRLVDSIAQATDKLIAQSPVPIPGPVREALDKMREALAQLSGSIDVINAGASSLTKDPTAADPSRRQAMEDARVAFVDLEASDDNADNTEQKKPRRHRSRRGGQRQGQAHDDNRTSATASSKDRTDSTSNS